MPSPVGHALGGLIAGWTVAGAPAITAASWRRDLPAAIRHGAPFALLATAPDLDLLVGLHSRYTHSLGAALLVALVTFTIVSTRRAAAAPDSQARSQARRARTLALACGLAWASHVLLDWLGSDTSPPLGVMALWPWSTTFFQSDLYLFLATERRYWLPGFVGRILYALMWELILLLPLLLVTWWARRPATSARAGKRKHREEGLPADAEADHA